MSGIGLNLAGFRAALGDACLQLQASGHLDQLQ